MRPWRRLRFSGRAGKVIRVAGIGVLVASLAVLGVSNASAAERTRQFTPAPSGLAIKNLPLGVSNAMTTVMVQMAGDPVTVTDADSATPMTSSQKQTQRDQLRAAQVPAEQRIRELGGNVAGNYQSAYNGIKVRIPARNANALLDIPNVVAVHPVQTMKPDNTRGVPLIGAPEVWDGLGGYHGEGVKVAVIDTGIDWTHADFGGPGTAAAYTAAHANETQPADPRYFGPNAPKVKGGVDLVGDSYNADPTSPAYQPVPHPDPNPLDCAGHGSHVAGTAVGMGVLADGTTYTGPYNDTTISGHQWLVGPGVAPKADLYSIRVFGCAGSTDMTVDAIEWAVDHNMDVINMSLGSDFGSADDPGAVAASNAAKAGVIVVASSGNEGSSPYMTGTPASGSGVISVAANDSTPSNPGAHLALSTGSAVDAIDANGVTFADGTTLPVKVLRTASGGISLGCDPAEYTAAGVTGKLVVVQRGTCARVARAIFGQQAGAAAVLMVNTDNSLPPYEGPITNNPDTGEKFNVTIPFLGVKQSDGAAVVAADGGTVALSALTIPNVNFLAPASFTSGGPRSGDSALKPDVTAPGVGIFSAGIGTGNSFSVLSGTSMAAPHTAGMAALVRQAHPTWKKVQDWKAAIVNTADPSKVAGYTAAIGGAGLIQAVGATQTQVVALGDPGTATLSYGFAELGGDYNQTKTIKLHNFGNVAASFDVATTRDAGKPHSVALNTKHVTVPARGDAMVQVRLSVPSATAGGASFQDVSGLVQFTPTGGGNNGVSLRVPYYLVPQAVSHIATTLDTRKLANSGSATATVTNRHGANSGAADWYAWGLTDGKDRGLGSNDVRAVGVQAFPGVLAFAISTQNRWSNASEDEFDILVDVNGDGVDDYDVVSADLGALTAGTNNGETAVAVFNLATGAGSIQFLADAPTDSSTIVLPVNISQLCGANSPCLSSSNPRFTYHAVGFGLTDGTEDDVDGKASFNAFSPAISTGMFDVLDPGKSATETVSINRTEFGQTPPLGLMIVSHDNPSNDETQLIPVKLH